MANITDEPEVVTRGRSISMRWPVSEPNSDGWTAYAELRVSYSGNPRYAYSSRLRSIETRDDNECRWERIDLTGRDDLLLALDRAPRFGAKRLREIANRELTNIRRLAGEGHPRVPAYFSAR